MVCTANDLSAWKDFPKGLRVLILDENSTSAADINFHFCNENEAMSAISSKSESFHVAIVEVTSSDSSGIFKFLENAKDLPTIMTSNIQCLSTMMKCLALGAVEFLKKPISEDKLRNIWQHVVHKVFNAGGAVVPKSLRPIKESAVSMLQLKVENEELANENSETQNNVSLATENDHEKSPGTYKYPAPSTPQLKQGGRLLDDGDCQDHTNCSTEKESVGKEEESKSVENTCTIIEGSLQVEHPESLEETVVKKEDDLADGTNNRNKICQYVKNNDILSNSSGSENGFKFSIHHSATRVNRKKMKVDWTAELHKEFVQAVDQLGIDQAIPSRILELMKVEGLTRHNVASHLQKYRLHRRHILPKEDDRRWQRQGDQLQRSYYLQKPIMAYPPYHSNHSLPPSPFFPMWGAATSHPAGVQMWGPSGYPLWPPADAWHWRPYPGMHADGWGCPVMPARQSPYLPQNAADFHGTSAVNSSTMLPNSADLHPADELIDKVMKEAISKPWLPLPLGLRPPSTDSVLSELSNRPLIEVCPFLCFAKYL
ncbi:hypothetical protein K2173_002762 [Erythroxylum novogranatense]|uniref:HTH myb-type domain-containing protein n=1 Tax=Erythroxylum novogranatense TaxID=1862640 RepID=A0AAV8SPV4_9ROSI|nr:hypothetical protein K2173_002762 [Erythroxylum novogranatense]